ncbi:MAG: S41 family peptidase [Steroidobacteraceae bacterium]
MNRSLSRHGRASRFARLTALVCMLAPAFAAEARTYGSADTDWKALTLRDVDAMHALLRDNTPITFDTENPAYARWLEEGHAVAQDRAAKVIDEAGYLYTLNAYANGFHDPHFTVQLDLPSATRWPGFIAVERGDAAVVVQRDAQDPSAPALGARIESCDGQPLSALVQSRVLPFSVAAGPPDRWALHNLFLDQQNPFAQLPASCSVRTGEQSAELPLQWRGISGVQDTFTEDLTETIFGRAAAWGLSEPSPGVFWIGVPTFLPTEEATPQMRALIAAIKARGDEMRHARAIIIDTRHNSGGYAFWARQLSEAIFTPKVLKNASRATPARRVAYELRVSPGNLKYKREKLQRIGSDLSAAQRRDASSEADMIQRAIARKTPMLREGGKWASVSGGMTAQRPRGRKSPFPAQVYFLSNGSCLSACLLFADQALMVPGVRLIGSATGGDTPYIDIREEKLPSGLATLSLPQTVMRGRGRGAMESYAADIPYIGSWDDASIRAWTLSLIQSGS